MKLTTLNKQQGYLAVLAILLIVVIGFIGTTIVAQYANTASSVSHFQQSDQTFYIANAGLQKAARQLLTPYLSGSNPRISCAAVTGNSKLTHSSFGNGTFTVTTVSGSPIYANTTLRGSIASSNTTIPVASTSHFASAGLLMIDREVIAYGGISGNNFIGIQRGAAGSVNSSHASGAPLTQYQCTVSSLAGIPNLTSSHYRRRVQQAIPLQEAWAVGAASSSRFRFTRWNQPTQLNWTDSSISSNANNNLNSVSMLSNADGWAVGNIAGTNFTILHWTGSSWSLMSAAASCNNQHLTGVSAVSSTEAWAVGARWRTGGNNSNCSSNGGNKRYTILRWNGSTWSQLAPSTIPADTSNTQNLNAVHVIATTGGAGNIGFAVGNSGQILRYNGSTWATVSSPTTQNLNSVYVVSTNEAWAAGNSGVILKWNGNTWNLFYTVSGRPALHGISMLDQTNSGTAQSGWAVGANGTAFQYNGSSWADQSPNTNRVLNSVAAFSANDVWIAANNGSLFHWDGGSWSSIDSNLSVNLSGVDVIRSRQSPAAWQEVFS